MEDVVFPRELNDVSNCEVAKRRATFSRASSRRLCMSDADRRHMQNASCEAGACVKPVVVL